MGNDNQNQFKAGPTTISAPLPQEPKHKMKLWKKILLVLVILVVVIGAGIYFLPYILTLLHPGDAVKADDSNLILQKISVADSDNGFYDLNKITKDMINIPVNDQKISLDVELTDYTKSLEWNQQLVDQVLNQNQQALSLFDAAASKDALQIPDYADPSNLNSPLYPMGSWRTLARLQAIKAISLSFQNKPDQALQEAAKLNKLGHNIINGHNSFIGTLVGISIQELGSQTILKILPYNNPSRQVLETALAIAKNNSDNLEGYENAFRFQYTSVSNQMDDFNTQLGLNVQQKIEDGSLNPSLAKYVKYSYYYKPMQTKNLYIDLYNPEVAAVGVKCELSGVDGQINSIIAQTRGWKLFFAENAIGKLLFSVTGVSLGGAITKQCQNDLIANVAQIELALREYKIDKGSLPNSLSDLTSQYLSSVPVDPFDHQPIRYSATKKTLYSVGLKKQDLGGSEGSDWMKMDNPTFGIGF